MLNRLTLKIRPNNQITVTTGNFRKNSEPDIYRPRSWEVVHDSRWYKEKLSRRIDNIRRAKEPKFDWRGNPLPEKAKKRIPSTLDIIGKSQRKARTYTGNRPKSFTAVSGQRVRECGSAIDHISASPSLTRAITLTLPADHVGAFKALADYSGYVINRLFQPVRRKHSENCHWFFVWEYQRRGALHLHIALYHPDASVGEALGNTMIEQWLKILSDIQAKTGVDMFCQKDLKTYTPREKYQNQNQPMRRSLGAYFSKYAGKQESKDSHHCQAYPVSRFWGCGYQTKRLVKSLSFDYELASDDTKIIEEMATKIIERLAAFHTKISSNYDFLISIPYGRERRLTVAEGTRTAFYCCPKSYQLLRDLLEGDVKI
jgi:hypothetical protein